MFTPALRYDGYIALKISCKRSVDWRMGCFWRSALWMLHVGKVVLLVMMNGTLSGFFISRLCSVKVSFLGIALALEIWLFTKWFLYPHFVE